GGGFFRPDGARPSTEVMVSFIDEHRDEYGVEPICRMLPIAPSVYFDHAARRRDPELLPARSRTDVDLREKIDRIWRDTFELYGHRKMWKRRRREGVKVAGCTVQRLMRKRGLQGAVRGRTFKTTVPELEAIRPPDLVARNFTASGPNKLWVADLTYVATWKG